MSHTPGPHHPYPDNEVARVRALHALDILDTLPEQAYDDVTLLASQVCGAPIALISLVDAERQWFKSRVGVEFAETARAAAFCARAILEPDRVLTVPDTRADPRFADNPLVTGGPRVRFYAGAPIVTERGEALGTVCVMDSRPRRLDPAQRSCLEALARQAELLLELRARSLDAGDTVPVLGRATALLERTGRIAHVGGWEFDVDRGRLTWSDALRRIHEIEGEPPRELARALDFHRGDARTAIAEAIDRAMHDGTPYDLELPLVTAKGRTAWVRSIGAAERVAGRTTRLFGTIQDVGDRKRVEQALVESERRVRTITDNIPALIAHIDRQGRYTFVNAPLGRYLGEPPEQVVGRTLVDVRGSRYPHIEPQVRAALEGTPVAFELSEDRLGRLRHLQSFFVPDVDGDGRVDGFYAMTLDVTERKQAELQQAETEARLRGITDALPALIAEIDDEHRFRFCNRTYRSWLGIDHETVIGRRLEDVLDPAYHGGRAAYLELALAGEVVSFEQTVELPIGTRTLQTTYLPNGDGHGAVVGVYAMTSDITALKDVEHRLDLLTRIDPLTGLANRRQFEDRVGAAMARTRRSGEPMAIVFLDVDHFKSINDTLGHAAGDTVLKVFAERLTAAVRQSDTVARYAGDEFVVVLEQLANVDEGGQIAEKIVVAMRRPFELPGSTVDVTASAGVATYTGGEASPSKLLSLADQALYRAKSEGRDRSRVATR